MYTNRSGWHRKRVSGRMRRMGEKAKRRTGEKLGGARRPNCRRLLTKLLTLLIPNARLDRSACRAVGLRCRQHLGCGRDGPILQANPDFLPGHTYPRLGKRIGLAGCFGAGPVSGFGKSLASSGASPYQVCRPYRYLITPVSVRRFFAQAASLCPESAGISMPKLTVWIREPDTPSEIK